MRQDIEMAFPCNHGTSLYIYEYHQKSDLPPPWSPACEGKLMEIEALGRLSGANSFKQWHSYCPILDMFVFSYEAFIYDRAGAE